VREAVNRTNSRLSLFGVSTMDRIVQLQFRESLFFSKTATALMFVAMILTAGGIYSITQLTFNLRLSEIGIRMALGAQKKHVYLLFLKETVMIAMGGSALGGILSFIIVNAVNKITPIDTSGVILYAANISIYVTLLVVLIAIVPITRGIGRNPISAIRYS
jgi:ABC-type antimicrobial peptide transport system permease subunit